MHTNTHIHRLWGIEKSSIYYQMYKIAVTSTLAAFERRGEIETEKTQKKFKLKLIYMNVYTVNIHTYPGKIYEHTKWDRQNAEIIYKSFRSIWKRRIFFSLSGFPKLLLCTIFSFPAFLSHILCMCVCVTINQHVFSPSSSLSSSPIFSHMCELTYSTFWAKEKITEARNFYKKINF